MNYATIGDAQAAAPPSVSALDEILSKLRVCHDTVSDIHGIADRACGIRDEAGAVKPTSVPSGLLDEILDTVSALNERLSGAANRLSRVA